MSPARSHQSSGSEGDPRLLAMDERKQKRKLSNRESARRSRMRKQRHLEDLVSRVTQLKSENSRILTQVDALSQHHQRLEAENAVLRAQAGELSETLRSLNSVLRFVGEFGGAAAMDVAGIPDPLLIPKPWQQPIMASADVIQY